MTNGQELASLWSRVAAGAIDFIIVFAFSGVICFVWGYSIGLDGSERYLSREESDALWQARGVLVGLLVDCVYTVGLMASSKQATYGQRVLGIKVVKNNGTRVGYGSALTRYVVSLFSSIILKIGYLVAIFEGDKKTLHDGAAGTIVIKAEHSNKGVDSESSVRVVPAPVTLNRQEPIKEISQLTKASVLDVNLTEDEKNQIYSKVFDEVNGDAVDKGLWARCFAEVNGNENELKALYIRRQAEKLMNEAVEEKRKQVSASDASQKHAEFEALKNNYKKNKPSTNFDVGMQIYKGYGDVQPSPTDAVPYLYEAAIRGVTKAQFNLSLMYWKGDGVAENKAEAYAWCRIAANSIDDAKDNLKHYSKNMSLDEILESDKLAKKYVDLIQS